MNYREDIIGQINDALGSEGSRELATAVYDRLQADWLIGYDARCGLYIEEGVDLIAVATEVIEASCEA